MCGFGCLFLPYGKWYMTSVHLLYYEWLCLRSSAKRTLKSVRPVYWFTHEFLFEMILNLIVTRIRPSSLSLIWGADGRLCHWKKMHSTHEQQRATHQQKIIARSKWETCFNFSLVWIWFLWQIYNVLWAQIIEIMLVANNMAICNKNRFIWSERIYRRFFFVVVEFF